LNELCATSEAKKSLWDWYVIFKRDIWLRPVFALYTNLDVRQLLYARSKRNEKFLPNGGTMINARGSWVSRMGKAIKQEGKELGKKTSMAFRTRNSEEDSENRLGA